MYIITTPIPYTNAAPHLGHLLEGLYTDTIARYQRIKLGPDQVLLTMGLDQHGLKIYQKALESNQTPEIFVEQTGLTFSKLWEDFDIKPDTFVATHSKRHILLTQAIFRILQSKGFIYKKEYNGLYCVGCEDFYAPSQLNETGCCPIHLTKPIEMAESNYFFKLSEFEKEVTEFLKVTPIKPESIKNEWFSFVNSGLQDISCSREKSRLPWGVEVPNDDSQVMYVWIEALLNYCTAIFNEHEIASMSDEQILSKLQKEFPIDFMYCSKEISKFHLVIFPALLSALEIPLPKRSVAHGMINDSKGIKMSKTLGNVIDPYDVLAKFGKDGSRFVFLHEINIWGDSPFDWHKIAENYNAYLANNLGNIFTRVSTMVEKYGYDMNSNDLKYDWSNYHKYFEEGDTKSAFDEVFNACSRGNEFLELKKPWMLAKDEAKRIELDETLGSMVNHLQDVADKLTPFLPDTAAILQEAINLAVMSKIDPIFTRLEI
jgi:methionyl-tRNA synthetase